MFRPVDLHDPKMKTLALGETLRLPHNLPRPLSGVTEGPAQHGTSRIIAFGAMSDQGTRPSFTRDRAHLIQIERLCDGKKSWLAAWYWLRLREEYHG